LLIFILYYINAYGCCKNIDSSQITFIGSNCLEYSNEGKGIYIGNNCCQFSGNTIIGDGGMLDENIIIGDDDTCTGSKKLLDNIILGKLINQEQVDLSKTIIIGNRSNINNIVGYTGFTGFISIGHDNYITNPINN